MKQNEIFMNMALQEARDAYDEGEVPVGAVLTCNGHLVAKGHNQTERLTDITAHAEMLVLTAGMEALHSKFLSECNLYVTLEPCIMCAGAIALARIKQLHFAAFDEKRGYRKYSEHVLHPKTEVITGLMELDSSKLLKKFFRERRGL